MLLLKYPLRRDERLMILDSQDRGLYANDMGTIEKD